jgi:hypothetical protein
MQIQALEGTSLARRVRTLAGALSVLLVGTAMYAQGVRAQTPTPTLSSAGTIAVTTYEAAGLYWQSPGGTGGCEVRYRKDGESAWKQGLAMWYDARDGQCRGSLVGLEAGTWYQAELNLPGEAATRGLVFQTWANAKPVAKTIAVNAGSAQYTITEGGTPSGWVVYEGNGATLDAQDSAQYNIHVKASYVIVRGLNLRGAKQDAIRLDPSVHDVVIEDNDVSGWGRTRDGTWGADMDSAVRGVCTSDTQLVRITIQRNRMHDPRYSANSWSDGHPAGPQAVALSHCGGQLVIRHNEMYSTNGKYFNDIIGGEDNFTKVGFPNADSDIYGNRLSHAWDDAIESEGANENVRIWGNYIDRTAIGIATTATSVGPVYVFRNVWNRSQMYAKVASLDQDDRQPFFKSGGTMELGHGRRYILHNTMLQARQSGLSYGLGGGFGLGGTGSAQLIENTWSRNNIYHQWKEGKGFTYQTGSTSSFVSDMYNGTPGDATVASGIQGTPVYASGHGWQSEAGGMYQLASTSPGFGKGAKIANFNDAAAAPDVGAHQSGAAAMKFGVAASAGSAVGGGAAPTAVATLANISTRLQVLTGDDVMIGGFVIEGTAPKTVVVRARGPSLSAFGVADVLANPMLELYSGQTRIALNDDFGAAANASQLQASGFAPSHAREAAILVTLAPGAYTAIVSGSGGGTGVGLMEVFQVDRPESPFTNLSTRGQVRNGNDAMIGGFIIEGSGPRTVVVRARGPTLAAFGIANGLSNPTLQLVRSSDQAVVAANDDWQGAGNAAAIGASGFAPADARESAILVTLAPGAYTAIVAGAGGVTGVGIVEVFALP